MIDCRKLDGTDRDKKLEIHVGRNSRIMKSILGSKDYELDNLFVGNITIPLSQERPDHDLRERTLQFLLLSVGKVAGQEVMLYSPVVDVGMAATATKNRCFFLFSCCGRSKLGRTGFSSPNYEVIRA